MYLACSFLISCFFPSLTLLWMCGLELLCVNISLTFPSFRLFFLFWNINFLLSFFKALSNFSFMISWGYFLSSSFYFRLSRWKSLFSTEEHCSTTLNAWLYGILDLQWSGFRIKISLFVGWLVVLQAKIQGYQFISILLENTGIQIFLVGMSAKFLCHVCIHAF